MNQPLKQLFVPETVLSQIKDARSVRRKRTTWGKSKLTKYQSELIQLRAIGASFVDLQFWLLKEKRVKASPSTFKRFLEKVCTTTNKEN